MAGSPALNESAAANEQARGARGRRVGAPGGDDYDDRESGRRRLLKRRRCPCPGTAGGPGETSPGPGACPRGPREAAAAAMEIPPQEAPPGPGADGDAEEAPAEARSPSPASPPADGRLKAAAKRVTFPSDEDIVSGAVEPKDPWRHGSYSWGAGAGSRGSWELVQRPVRRWCSISCT